MTQSLVTANEESRCEGRAGKARSGAVREVEPAVVIGIVEKHKKDLGALIAILEAIQGEYGYLPESALRQVSDGLSLPLVDVHGVATFYSSFSLKPRGQHVVCACLGTACHVRGAPLVVGELERQLGVKSGETTASGEFTLQTANCLGACALGPVVVVDGHYFSKVPKSRVAQLINAARTQSERTDAQHDERLFPLMVGCPRCHRSLKDESKSIDARPSIRLRGSASNRSGSLWLSSLYGSHRVESEREVPVGTVVELSCPHCQTELLDSWICQKCEAPMASMAIDGGGTVRICRRRGCTCHMLDLA